MHRDLPSGIAGLLSSLKLRITAGSIASLVLGIGLITVVLANRAERDTLRDQRQRELSESVRTATVLTRNMVELQRALAVVAEQGHASMLNDEHALATFIEGKPVLRKLFSNVFIASLDGRMLLFADEKGMRKLDFNVADRDYFKRTLVESRPMVSKPMPGRLSGEPVVVLTHPMRTAGGVYAVIGGGLRLSSRDLLANLVDVQDSDEGALTVVTDADGTVIAHPDRSRLMQPLSSERRLSGAYEAWIEAGRPVEPSGLQLHQDGEVVSAAGVAGPDWMVWRARPERELLEPLRAARREALVWAGGLIVLISALTLMLVAWLLRPLAQLERRAGHLFDGSLPPQDGWPEVSGEIGRLAQVLKRVGTDRLLLEGANNDLLKRLGSVMSASPVGIAFTRNQRFELVSAEFCRLFMREEAEFIGVGAALIYATAHDYAQVGLDVSRAFQAGLAYAGEWQMVRADGSCFWGQLRGSPVDSGSAAAGTIWTLSDVSEQRQDREALTWTAGHDPLTGLANRREFEDHAAALVNKLPASLPATVIFIDLDHFKPINDQGGHGAGDAMLVAVATAIASAVRATDLAARLGGDEFAVLLQGCNTPTALRIAENIRQAVTAIVLPWGPHAFVVGASLGVADLNPNMGTVGAWLALADAACYEAKAAGRGAVRLASAHATVGPASGEPLS